MLNVIHLNRMRIFANFTMLIVLLLAMAAIQFRSVRPIRPPIAPNSLRICLIGWPVGYHLSFAKGTPTGGIEYQNRTFYHWQAILDGSIALAMLMLSYLAIARGIIQTRFKISILQLLSVTTGIGFAITYFTWNHDIFIWNCRVNLGSPDNPLVIGTLNRPYWQNAIVAMFIMLSTSALAHFVFGKIARVTASNGG